MKAALIAFCACALAIGTFAQKDLRLEVRATGKSVVEAVVTSIQESGIFPDDNRLLRRIAHVASRDGQSDNTFRPTLVRFGIWQTPVEAFRDTRSNPIVQLQREAIKDIFGVDWKRVKKSDLRKPLISGLAARLLLAIISDSHPIPEQDDIEGQARYWHQYYSNGRPNEERRFVNKVVTLEEIERKSYTMSNSDAASVYNTHVVHVQYVILC